MEPAKNFRGEEVPTVRTRVRFLPNTRIHFADLVSGKYMPHIIITEDPERFVITQGESHSSSIKFLGVRIINGPELYELDAEVEVDMILMYHPDIDYRTVQAGQNFVIQEGNQKVGLGTVIARSG